MTCIDLCSRCGTEVTDANKYTARSRVMCRACGRESNSEAQKKYRCRVKYGVDTETYDKVMSAGHCEVCGKTTDLVYDHNHDTMEPRGCLCRQCNRAIGQLGDTLDDIMKVVRYLKHDIH